jgi:Y-X(10)_GDL-associated radical SAM protein
MLPRRYETHDDYAASRPILAVWEITLACNLKCTHCGSRAGNRRVGELTTAECLDVVAQLARMGVREVALIGGEAFLRRDWIEIIKTVRDHGMDCSMQTGGRGLTEQKIQNAAQAGLMSCGVSIDGLRALHDRLRGVPGSYDQAMAALGHLRKHGVPSSVSTQIGSEIMPELRELMHRIVDVGARNWQIQLTVAMGNAADKPELLLQPYRVLDLMPLLAELHEEAMGLGLLLQPANNIGYFGPYEHRWRIVDDALGHWQGCSAGQTSIGIEADGTIKGCPSLPTMAYAGGNVRQMTIEQMWELSDSLRFARDRTVNDLWGFCRTCYYADVCRGGCTWTSHVLFGRPGNNPYCHYRALELARHGLRERVEKVADAPGEPFDYGRFNLIVEPVSGGDGPRTIAVPPPVATDADRPRNLGATPTALVLCHGCDQYVFPGTITCPHCGSDVASMAEQYATSLGEAEAAATELARYLESINTLPTESKPDK